MFEMSVCEGFSIPPFMAIYEKMSEMSGKNPEKCIIQHKLLKSNKLTILNIRIIINT